MKRVRVSTASFPKHGGVEEQRSRALEFVALAAADDPDLIVLPENCFNDASTAEPVPGVSINMFAELCRRYRVHVLVPLIQIKQDGNLYNSAVLLNPNGEVAGEYLKMFPTDYEMREGVRPGWEPRVFETAIGRIGVAICFDVNFTEVVEGIARRAPDLVCFPSAFQGGRLLAKWALEHGVYIASAHRGGVGMMIDKSGRVLEQGDGQYQPVISRTLNFDRQVFHLDYNYLKLPEIRERFGRSVAIEVHRPEALFTLESLSDKLTVDMIVEEYGLEPLRNYFERTRRERETHLRTTDEQQKPTTGTGE